MISLTIILLLLAPLNGDANLVSYKLQETPREFLVLICSRKNSIFKLKKRRTKKSINKYMHIMNGNIQINPKYEKYLEKDLTYFPFTNNFTIDENIIIFILLALTKSDGDVIKAATSNSRYFRNYVAKRADFLKIYLIERGYYTPKFVKRNDKHQEFLKIAKNIYSKDYVKWKNAFLNNFKKNKSEFLVTENTVDGKNYESFVNSLNYNCAYIVEDFMKVKKDLVQIHNQQLPLRYIKQIWIFNGMNRNFRSFIAMCLWGILVGTANNKIKKILKCLYYNNKYHIKKFLISKEKMKAYFDLTNEEYDFETSKIFKQGNKGSQSFYNYLMRKEEQREINMLQSIELNVDYVSTDSIYPSKETKFIKGEKILQNFKRSGEQFGQEHYITIAPEMTPQIVKAIQPKLGYILKVTNHNAEMTYFKSDIVENNIFKINEKSYNKNCLKKSNIEVNDNYNKSINALKEEINDILKIKANEKSIYDFEKIKIVDETKKLKRKELKNIKKLKLDNKKLASELKENIRKVIRNKNISKIIYPKKVDNFNITFAKIIRYVNYIFIISFFISIYKSSYAFMFVYAITIFLLYLIESLLS